MKALFIIPFIIQTVFANWQGCIRQQDLDSGRDGKVRRDTETAVCLTIAKDASDWSNPTEYDRFSFEPSADNYSRLVVNGCK
jgi:hypothetical protein